MEFLTIFWGLVKFIGALYVIKLLEYICNAVVFR